MPIFSGGDKVSIDSTSLTLQDNGQKPIGVELGVPDHGSANNNGKWQGVLTRGELTPSTRPSIFTQNHYRSASGVDDAGRLVLGNSTNSIQKQVFCINLVTNPAPSGAFNCGPDIAAVPGAKGAGVLLRRDNCDDGTDLGGSVDGGQSLPFTCGDPQVSKWYTTNADQSVFGGLDSDYSSPTELTRFIGRNGSGNLNDFYVHLDARNTQQGGFSVSAIMTFRYRLTPDNKATLSRCAGQSNIVNAGDTICLVPGMQNMGNIGNSTYVELDSYVQGGSNNGSTYLSPVSSNATGDPYGSAGPYDTGCMSNGQCEGHYWWGRSQSPAYGTTAWSVQYQNTRLRISPTTPTGTTLCFQTLVNPATTAGTYAVSTQKECFSVGTGQPPITTVGCPSLPDPIVDVFLPDKSPNNPNPPSLFFTYTRGDTYDQDTRLNKTRVSPGGLVDISNGGVPTPPTLVDDTTTYQHAKINYSPYVTAYPYDTNKARVNYDSYYKHKHWWASSTPDGVVCPSGWDKENGTGPNCIAWYPAGGPTWTCPDGSAPIGSGYGPVCAYTTYQPVYSPGWYCAYPTNGPYATGFGYLCQYNGSWSGPAWPPGTLIGYAPVTNYYQATGPTYTCPYGGVQTSTAFGVLCRQSVRGTDYYLWHSDPEVAEAKAPGTADGPTMNPCWNRTYNASPVAGTATLTPDPENPNQASFSGQINVNFGVDPLGGGSGQDPLRVKSKINSLPYTIAYYIQHASGAAGPTTELNDAVTIEANDYNRSSQGSSGALQRAISVNIPGNMQVGDTVCWTLYTTSASGFSRTQGKMDVNGNYIANTGSGRLPAQSCSPPAINEPYLRVYGGDVLAGSGFGVGCAVNNNASILGWNKGNGAGSGVQFAAQAAAIITDFSSASLRGSIPTPPKGLSFGNTTGTYGGDFGSGQCAKDYFANATNIQQGYTTSGSTVVLGARQAVYVNGDAFIRGNIVYAGNGSWANLSQIPSYYLVVKGNIYISEQVTQLDGVYIAQPAANGSGGEIYTCVDNDTRQVRTTSPDAFTRCQTKLTINGSFIANQVHFLRTNGSLRDSTVGENANSSTIAEVFNYSPEIYLVDPALTSVPSRQYDSATALPPVL